jgi:gas vesicle protein
MNAGKFWAVFTIGVAAGAAVALIYAPQTGAKTRRQLRRRFEDAGEYLQDASESLSDYADKYAKHGRDIVENVADSASSAYSAARKVVPI